MSILRRETHLVPSASSIFNLVFGLTLCLSFLQARPAHGQGNTTFYIDNGRGIQKVENGDPTKLKVTEWHVRLYKKGRPTGGTDNWGLITGKSAESVMAKLKKAQDFELRFNAWVGKGRVPDDVQTHFNPLGPIAVVEREPTERERETDSKRLIPKDLWDKIQSIYDRAKGFYDGYQHIIDITSTEPKTRTPFDNVGNGFREYMDNLRDVFERVLELRQRLEGATAPSMDEINRALNEITRSLDAAGHSARRVSSGLGIKEDEIIPPNNTSSNANQPASNNTATESNSDTERRLEELANQLSSAFENMDPNDPEAVFQRIRDIARQMIRIIESDPASDANMKELARLLLSITETTDPEALSNQLERLTELLERITP